MTAITHNTAKIGDINLHYAECGAGKDELVILLHGFPEFWYTWKDQLPSVGEKYHAVAPDMRGYNLSDKPEGLKNYRIGPLVGDVLNLADHFGKKEFYLVAHDWGAAVAWAVAIGHPERIKGLVILNGPHPYIFSELLTQNRTQIEQSQYMAYFRNEGVEDKLLANDCKWLWDWTFARHIEAGQMSEEDQQAYIAAWTRPGAMTAMLNYYRASPLTPAKEEDIGKSLGLNPDEFRVRVPTLVVWGEKDHALIPENLIGLDRFVDDLKIIRLPDVTHWVTHEASDRAAAEITGFIDDLEAGKARQ